MKAQSHVNRPKLIAVLACAAAAFLFSSCAIYEGFYGAIRDANGAAAVKTLTNIAEQQTIYFNSHKREAFGTFDELLKDGFLDSRYGGTAPVVSGYVFTMRITPKSPGRPPAFAVNADPQQADGINATGKNHYYLDNNTNTVRVNSTQPAAANDPQIQP